MLIAWVPQRFCRSSRKRLVETGAKNDQGKKNKI